MDGARVQAVGQHGMASAMDDACVQAVGQQGMASAMNDALRRQWGSTSWPQSSQPHQYTSHDNS